MGCGSSSGGGPASTREGTSDGADGEGGGGGGEGVIPGVLPNTRELLEGARIPQADSILPLLLLGNLSMSKNKRKMQELGIKRILNVTQHSPPFPNAFLYETVAVDDTQGADIRAGLERGVQFIADGIDAGEKVFVHCEMGMSRSTTYVVAYLLFKKGWSVRRGLLQVKLSRPIVRVTRSFVFVLLDSEVKLLDEGNIDQELLVEEGMQGAVEGDAALVTATSLQLFFFPNPSVVRDNLEATGLLPSEWDTGGIREKFLAGVSMQDLEDQTPPSLEEIKSALKGVRSTRQAYNKLRKQHGTVSPFIK